LISAAGAKKIDSGFSLCTDLTELATLRRKIPQMEAAIEAAKPAPAPAPAPAAPAAAPAAPAAAPQVPADPLMSVFGSALELKQDGMFGKVLKGTAVRMAEKQSAELKTDLLKRVHVRLLCTIAESLARKKLRAPSQARFHGISHLNYQQHLWIGESGVITVKGRVDAMNGMGGYDEVKYNVDFTLTVVNGEGIAQTAEFIPGGAYVGKLRFADMGG